MADEAKTMHAMVLPAIGGPLELREVPRPACGPYQVAIRVEACAVCRTDLHVLDGDGELRAPKLPLIPGHEVVGRIVERGAEVRELALGDRVGIPWLGWTCGDCRYCRNGQENLCDRARFTGYQLHGGYAEYAAADHRFCFSIPAGYSPSAAAPLLCAGLIGYRCLRMAGDARRLGFYGFGAAAHILIQIARSQGREVHAFTRPGDAEAQAFARELGAVWAGGSDEAPPELLDSVILFAPVGGLVPAGLRAVVKGGVVVCGGIHMSDIPSFPYAILWGERVVRSVANLTREDGREFFAEAARTPIETRVRRYPLAAANAALDDLRHGRFSGAAVLDLAEG